jgi:uncharacterized coiled-coil protein SlyX
MDGVSAAAAVVQLAINMAQFSKRLKELYNELQNAQADHAESLNDLSNINKVC